MKVLVACEFSGRVRDSFVARGHDAYSCDRFASVGRHPRHLLQDVRPLLRQKWDLVIAHPPCTYLCNSGVRWMDDERRERMLRGCLFFLECLTANADRVCVENPIPHRYAAEHLGPYTQIIQPWQFGHGETKATCLWLRNLPELVPTNIVSGRDQKVFAMPRSKWRSRERAVTYWGIAKAMAEQWG